VSHLPSAILLAMCSNVDNLGVGVAYGLRGRGFRIAHTLLIAGVSGAATLASMAAGEWINDFMPEPRANLIGSGLLVLVGLQGFVHALRETGRRLVSERETTSREAAVLAVALSLNNVGSGLGAGISHVSIPVTTALTVAGSVAALVGGSRLGRQTTPALSQRSLGIAAGVIVAAVGFYEFFV
jgi:putative Mn2+ efflux pump MntP